jgi:peptidyl-prolyl cis-trans isomerase C
MTDPRKVIPVTRKLLRRAALSCLAAALATSAGLLAGCSKNDRDVLARVNGEAITVAQFNEVARASAMQYSGPPDTAKVKLLKDLVDRELLVQGAVREGLRDTPEYQAFRQQLERQVLREALFQRLLGGPFPVTDAEVKEVYDRGGTATHTRLIFSYEEATARQALKDLERGDDFAAVADRYNPPGTVPPGGDIGFIQPASLMPPLDELVRTGPLNKVQGPISGGGEGWFVVRLEERRPQPRPPFEQVKGQITEMLRQRKQRVAVMKVVDNLKSDYQVEVVPGAPQTMVTRLRPAPGAAPGAAALAPLTAEERAQVLGKYRGGTYTLGEAYDDLMSGAGNRPNLSMLPLVQRWIESQAIERAALVEARKRHLADEPEVKDKLHDRMNNYLLDGYYQRQVLGRIQITPEDLAAAYERYKSSFEHLETARVVSVTMRDSAGAAALAEQAGHAPSLKEAAATAAAGGRVRDERLKFPASVPLWTQFEGKLMAMKPGEIAGPYPTPGGWLLFQLIEKKQAAPPFASLPAGARQQLQGAATEMKREARLMTLTDSLRRVLPTVEMHLDRLGRIPWPPAPLTPPGT